MSEDGKNLTSLDPLIGTLELNFNFYQQHQHQQKKNSPIIIFKLRVPLDGKYLINDIRVSKRIETRCLSIIKYLSLHFGWYLFRGAA